MFDDHIPSLIKAHFPDDVLENVAALEGGVSANVYRLTLIKADGRLKHLVLRIHGPTHGGHDAELEFQVLRFAHHAGLPVQAPIAVDASRKLLPAPYLLTDYADGTTQFAEADLEARLGVMARTLTAIHTVNLAGAPPLPERTDPIPDLVGFLPDTGEWQDLRAALSELKSTPYQGKPVFLHGDFWPGNLVWQGNSLAAVLDWEDAATGDPMCDVAGVCVELRHYFGANVMQRFAEAYAAFAPIDAQRLARWQAFVAAATLCHVGSWRLPPDREARIRREALATLRETSAAVLKA